MSDLDAALAAHGLDLAAALARVYPGGVPSGATIVKLRGDASTRAYFRLHAPGGTPASLVVMHLPADALTKSDEGTSGDHPAELPFLDVGRLLASRGVPVPRVLAEDLPHRILVLEDLGDETFYERVVARGEAAWPALYGQAVDLLADLHGALAPPADSIAYRRAFDEALLRWELDHFREWGIEAVTGPLASADRAALDGHFDRLARTLAGLPQGFVHRDYQSRNLMWAARPEGDALVVIDFQDALVGPRCYDLVALLCDSYVDIPEELQDAMIARYAGRIGLHGDAAREFEGEVWLQAVQRKLKDAGRFVFIDRVRGNPSFLESFPRSLSRAGRGLRRSGGLAELDALLRRLVPGFPDDCTVPPSLSEPARPSP